MRKCISLQMSRREKKNRECAKTRSMTSFQATNWSPNSNPGVHSQLHFNASAKKKKVPFINARNMNSKSFSPIFWQGSPYKVPLAAFGMNIINWTPLGSWQLGMIYDFDCAWDYLLGTRENLSWNNNSYVIAYWIRDFFFERNCFGMQRSDKSRPERRRRKER